MTEFEKHRKKFKYNKEVVSFKKTLNSLKPTLFVHPMQPDLFNVRMTAEMKDLINKFRK